MKTYRLIRRQKLPLTIHDCWDFFSDPDNLATITPDWLNFEVCSQIPQEIYAGLIIEYRVSPVMNVRLRWLTEITHANAPFYFVDEQRSGPYQLWHHQHLFEKTDSGTLMTDIVHYQLPLGIFGQWTQSVVAKKLQQIFDYREQTLRKLFPDDDT